MEGHFHVPSSVMIGERLIKLLPLYRVRDKFQDRSSSDTLDILGGDDEFEGATLKFDTGLRCWCIEEHRVNHSVIVWEKCESHENPYKVLRKIRTESKKWKNAVDAYEELRRLARLAFIPVSATEITNISEENLVCRSEELEEKRKGKKPVSVEESSEKKTDELIRSTKKPVTDEKLLKFPNEYSIIDIQPRISLLSLVSRSERHKRALMKWLREYHVSHDILVEDLSGILGNITASNSVTFTDKEIPPEGKGHNKALYIEVSCRGRLLTNVLVDNGSSMNIMAKSTFEKLKCDEKRIKTNSIVGVGFDGSKKKSLGEIELPIVIKSCVFKVKFQVMEVNSTFSCLLGRPWIHSAGVVPSSLHQSLKFMVDGELKVIHGVVPKPSSKSYIKAATAFQSLNWFLNLGLSHTSKLLELFNLWGF